MNNPDVQENTAPRRIGPLMHPMEALRMTSGGVAANLGWLERLAVLHEPPSNMMDMQVGHFLSIQEMGLDGKELWALHRHVLGADVAAFAALSEAMQSYKVDAAEIRAVVQAHMAVPREVAKAALMAQALLSKAGVEVRYRLRSMLHESPKDVAAAERVPH